MVCHFSDRQTREQRRTAYRTGYRSPPRELDEGDNIGFRPISKTSKRLDCYLVEIMIKPELRHGDSDFDAKRLVHVVFSET